MLIIIIMKNSHFDAVIQGQPQEKIHKKNDIRPFINMQQEFFFVNNSKNKIKFYLISTTINYFLKCCFFLIVVFIHVPFLWLSYLSFEEISCAQLYIHRVVVREIIVTLLLVFADDFIAFSQQPDVVVDVFIFRVRVSSWLNIEIFVDISHELRFCTMKRETSDAIWGNYMWKSLFRPLLCIANRCSLLSHKCSKSKS